MSEGVASDLSSEKPSGQGRHRIVGTVRFPWVGELRINAQSPDRSPASVATGWFIISVTGLAPPGLLALATTHARLAWWTVPAAATASAALLAAGTRFCLWYQLRRVQVRDLTKREGDPTERADLLLEHQNHDLTVRIRQVTVTELAVTSSPWSVPSLAVAFLTVVVAGLMLAAAFVGLATLVQGASSAMAIASAATVFAAAVTGGAVTMIRVEQHDQPDEPSHSQGRDVKNATT
ncbi:MAG TPA: hypothetical protein VFB06_37135 [Streptosporangiaceae bacterium]|nr:hypothetical protein [Streptosporangiaceae bacterium]